MEAKRIGTFGFFIHFFHFTKAKKVLGRVCVYFGDGRAGGRTGRHVRREEKKKPRSDLVGCIEAGDDRRTCVHTHIHTHICMCACVRVGIFILIWSLPNYWAPLLRAYGFFFGFRFATRVSHASSVLFFLASWGLFPCWQDVTIITATICGSGRTIPGHCMRSEE